MADYLMYFNLPSRLPEFAVGMWLASAWKQGRSGPGSLPFDRSFSWLVAAAFLFGIAGAFFAEGMSMPIRTIYEAACCFSVFIVLFLLPVSPSIGGSRAIVFLSGISYSVYLAHQPMLSYVYKGIEGLAGPLAGLGLLVLLTGPVCIGLAVCIDSLAGRLTGAADRAFHKN
jgi:peptidoglycan/LPS O-acetylase OafA/YrhL